MGQVSAKLRRYETGHAHWCPACNEVHILPDSWTFDGNLDRPTYSPSFKHSCKKTVRDEQGNWLGGWVLDAEGNAIDEVCHYILTNGVLNFCGDCTHGMAGQSVPLPDLPEWLRDEGFGG